MDCYGSRAPRARSPDGRRSLIEPPWFRLVSYMPLDRSHEARRRASACVTARWTFGCAAAATTPFLAPDEARAAAAIYSKQSQAQSQPKKPKNTMSLRDKRVAYRKRVADGKPAFCVFDNKTIDAIVDAKPTSVAAFGRRGIGPTKREKYGEDVVRICTEHGGGAARKPLVRRRSRGSASPNPATGEAPSRASSRRAARRPRSRARRARPRRRKKRT